MIFKHTHPWVLDVSPHTGEPKTQTRRPLHPGEFNIIITQCLHGITSMYTSAVIRPGAVRGVRRFLVGKVYAIQPGRGQRAVGQFTLTEIRRCAVAGDISELDARAEGFASPDAFREVWETLYGAAALSDPCWALTMAVLRESPVCQLVAGV